MTTFISGNNMNKKYLMFRIIDEAIIEVINDIAKPMMIKFEFQKYY